MPAATVEELLRCADVAMYAAKAGRTGVHIYVPAPQCGCDERLRRMEDLRTALEVGCDVAQGYAIARPMPIDAFLDWLATERPPLVPRRVLGR